MSECEDNAAHAIRKYLSIVCGDLRRVNALSQRMNALFLFILTFLSSPLSASLAFFPHYLFIFRHPYTQPSTSTNWLFLFHATAYTCVYTLCFPNAIKLIIDFVYDDIWIWSHKIASEMCPISSHWLRWKIAVSLLCPLHRFVRMWKVRRLTMQKIISRRHSHTEQV